MREFFKPWRRKLGVVMLGLACVFAAGWVRSEQTSDMYWLWTEKAGHAWFSTAGQFIWRSTFHLKPHDPRTINPGKWKRISGPINPTMIDHSTGISTKWSWSFYSFKIKKAELYGITTYLVFTPYWIVTIPLTLLSAYLILSKPRPANPPAPQST